MLALTKRNEYLIYAMVLILCGSFLFGAGVMGLYIQYLIRTCAVASVTGFALTSFGFFILSACADYQNETKTNQ